MTDTFSIASLTILITSHVPIMLAALQGTILDAGKGAVTDKVKDTITGKGAEAFRKIFHLDEKEQQRRLKEALENAMERGSAKFKTPEEQKEYRHVLKFLFESGTKQDILLRESLRQLTISGTPDFTALNDLYNSSLLASSNSPATLPANRDVTPYLSSFFEDLIAELYSDDFFRSQMSDILKMRAANNEQRSLTEIIATLGRIYDKLENNYTPEQFAQDVAAYTEHMERNLRHLKIAGVVPKDWGEGNTDPELNGIFVPLRIELQDQELSQEEKEKRNSIVALLGNYPYIVLLGGPGSGKSTAVRHLAWSHAEANLSVARSSPLLPGNPLPLRIELRRLTEARRLNPGYSFLSYVIEIQLKRDNITIDLQMFEELLKRRSMLLLFDGLDEVATLAERRDLIDQIEQFAMRYPGNRIIVTSRPVGYEFGRFSSQWFTHAEVQNFDDQQIRQFLENWYKHVLRLSPIPYDDQQGLETLFTTLKNNQRLHKLAENPLLLTVITALHRYEQLPDRRIEVYDRCANLLLETWAKIRGTDVRWRDMKMVKNDQRACVAHLGFVLHERSQKENEDSSSKRTNTSREDIASDVSARFMLKEIEHFIRNRKLMSEVAEQRAEANLFLKLMQEEAGLIVERGTGEEGEPLYGFIHRTFQEYFAAANVYECYKQEADPAIVSKFLEANLHDPHWHEVILLLLGKLPRKQATKQLRLILDGKLNSLRSKYNDIVQQDLFFVSGRLTGDILVESDFAEIVIARLCDVVKQSVFRSQQEEALEALGSLMQTRQYGSLAQRDLVALITHNTILDIFTTIEVSRILFTNSPNASEERRFAIQTLLRIAQRSDFTVEQRIQAAVTLYRFSDSDTEERRLAVQMLLQIAQSSDFMVEQRIEAAESLYNYGDTEDERLAVQILLQIAQCSDLTVEQNIKAIDVLYQHSARNPEEELLAVQMLLQIAQRSDLTIEQRIQATESLYNYGDTEDERLATQILLQIAQNSDLTVEQRIEAAGRLYTSSDSDTEDERLAAQILLQIAQSSDLTVEQRIEVAGRLYEASASDTEDERLAAQILLQIAQSSEATVEQKIEVAGRLYEASASDTEDERLAAQILLQIAQSSDLTVEQRIEATEKLYEASASDTEDERLAAQILLQIAQSSDLTVEQAIQAARALYLPSPKYSEEKRLATQILIDIAQNQDLVVDERLRAVTIFIKEQGSGYSEKAQAVRIILTLLPSENVKQHLEEHWRCFYHNETATLSEIPYMVELAQQDLLPTEARDGIYHVLYNMLPQFDKIPSP